MKLLSLSSQSSDYLHTFYLLLGRTSRIAQEGCVLLLECSTVSHEGFVHAWVWDPGGLVAQTPPCRKEDVPGVRGFVVGFQLFVSPSVVSSKSAG